jgi:photosystem II stability/assembly factor-like uncharacterized protein
MINKIYVKSLLIVAIQLLFVANNYCQSFSLQMLSSSKPTNLRGLSVFDSKTIWTCGSNGHIGKSINGGKTWDWVNPITYEKSDFRDIHAFSKDTVVVMAAGTPALILRTTDGGITWVEAFRSDDNRVFLDAFDFWDNTSGICVGDWFENKPYNLSTNNKGENWYLQEFDASDFEDVNLTYFAASGTCLRTIVYEGDTLFLATSSYKDVGMLLAFDRMRRGGFDIDAYEVPYKIKAPSEGLFSLCVDLKNEIVWVVGGDYAKPNIGFSAFYNGDDDEFFTPKSQVNGYRSCVELFSYNGKNMVIACGPNGADVSMSDAEKADWTTISQVPLNTAKKSRNGNTVFLCGKQGTIYKLIIE